MNRLIISAIGVILTFIWIVYTAPPRKSKSESLGSEPIKRIEKSGSTSLNKINQTDHESNNRDTTESKLYSF